MEEKRKEYDELYFSVDSQLLGELGERLVTKNYIALAELVKNAYDADATGITITFVKAKGEKRATFSLDENASEDVGGQIIVADNGNGMTIDQVKACWMRVATPDKVRNPYSTIYGRRKTGSKGIGRFACRRLAGALEIETTAFNEKTRSFETTKAYFNWSEDFRAGKDLTSIPNKVTLSYSARGSQGTILRLTGLNEKWTDSNFNVLRRQIMSLCVAKGTKRPGYKEDPGFSIRFDAGEFHGGSGDLSDAFMDAGWGKLAGKIGPKGEALLHLDAKGLPAQDFVLPQAYPLIKGIEFEVAIVPLKRQHFRDPKILTLGVATEILEEQGGIRVFVDGFRIYPYGEADEDWLEIDRKMAKSWGSVDSALVNLANSLELDPSRAMLEHPRYRNIVGRVYIQSNQADFEIKIDREGFIQNETFNQLVEMLKLSIQWAALWYGKYRLDRERDELMRIRREMDDIVAHLPDSERVSRESDISKAIWIVKSESKEGLEFLPEDKKEKANARIDMASKYIEKRIESTEVFSAMLSAVASSGTYFMNFAHEIKTLTYELDRHANTIDRLRMAIPSSKRPEFERLSQDIRRTSDRLDKQIKLFGVLGKTVSDLEKKNIDLKREVEEVVGGFQFLKEKFKFRFEIDIPNSLRTPPMLESELYSIVVNLVSNAVKAVIAGNGSRIAIVGESIDRGVSISVFDDGIGLSKEYWDVVFEPMTADPEKKLYNGLQTRIKDDELGKIGRGTGLGLAIVKGIVDRYGGSVMFVDPGPNWKTEIEVILR